MVSAVLPGLTPAVLSAIILLDKCWHPSKGFSPTLTKSLLQKTTWASHAGVRLLTAAALAAILWNTKCILQQVKKSGRFGFLTVYAAEICCSKVFFCMMLLHPLLRQCNCWSQTFWKQQLLAMAAELLRPILLYPISFFRLSCFLQINFQWGCMTRILASPLLHRAYIPGTRLFQDKFVAFIITGGLFFQLSRYSGFLGLQIQVRRIHFGYMIVVYIFLSWSIKSKLGGKFLFCSTSLLNATLVRMFLSRRETVERGCRLLLMLNFPLA